MNKKIRSLLERKAALVAEARADLASVPEGMALSAEVEAKHTATMASIEAINAAIKREEALEAELASLGAIETTSGHVSGGVPQVSLDPNFGFKHFGELLMASKNASMSAREGRRYHDERLEILSAAPTSAASGLSGADGGYVLPVGYSTSIIEAVEAPTSIYAQTDRLDIDTYSQKFPVDETTDWQTSGGIQAYRDGELNVLTQTGIKLKEAEFTASRLTCFVPVSNELLESAVSMGSYINKRAPRKMSFKVDKEVVDGTGVGQMLGMINSGCIISVAKESGQTADTIVRLNLSKMWMRMLDENRRNAVWLVNQDVEAQLRELQFVGTESPIPLYIPQGGMSASPFSTLYGRPVIYHQACKTLGDKGDIILADLSQFATVRKGTGIKADSSIHFFFDAYATAFRFIMYVGGRPWLSTEISPLNGSTTYSPFVTLDERA